jgi:hypothetical protein
MTRSALYRSAVLLVRRRRDQALRAEVLGHPNAASSNDDQID